MMFYLDENVTPAIAHGLRLRGVEATAAVEAGNLGLSDEEQLAHATASQSVLFTHDVDLIVLGRRWPAQGKSHCGVIYVHKESLSIGQCIARLLDYAGILSDDDMQDRVEFL